jgi:hypothetical protein
MHGSILPKMIVPLFAVAVWASVITVINQCVKQSTFSPQNYGH